MNHWFIIPRIRNLIGDPTLEIILFKQTSCLLSNLLINKSFQIVLQAFYNYFTGRAGKIRYPGTGIAIEVTKTCDSIYPN
jgi:hypothetical protein